MSGSRSKPLACKKVAVVEMPVYMIQAAAPEGPVKIGFSTNPIWRLTTLQTAHYERLSIMRLFEGNPDDEALLHTMFASHRIHHRNEWFTFDKAMLGDVGLTEIIGEVSFARMNNPRTTITLTEPLMDFLKQEAERLAVSPGEVVRRFVEQERREPTIIKTDGTLGIRVERKSQCPAP
jgi:hypothetical protein